MIQGDAKSKIGILRHILGEDFLAFTLGAQAGVLDGLEPDQLQVQVVDKLAEHAEDMRPAGPFGGYMAIERLLCTYNENIKTSSAIYFHYFSQGQAVPDVVKTNDPVLDSILTIARDTFPVFLINNSDLGGPSVFGATYEHPLRNIAMLGMTKSASPIRKLFPDAKAYSYYKKNLNELHNVRSNVVLSNGSIGTVSLSMMIESLLAGAVYAHHDKLDPLIPYLSSVRNNYKKVRRLANGSVIEHTVLLGLDNIDIDDKIYTINLPNAVMRRISHIEKNAMFGRDPINASVVVELKEKVKMLELYTPSEEDEEHPFRRFDKYSKEFNERFDSMQQRINRLRLAAILASSNSRVIAPSHSFTTSFSLLDMNRSWSTNPYRWPTVRYERVTLNADDVRQISYWAKRTAKTPKSLDVSMKRLISAITERIDDSDAFIDAVMVWENLFGAKEETGLRIRSSIALLLEPRNRTERLKIIKEIKALYEKRSRLVHGSPDVDLTQIHKDRLLRTTTRRASWPGL